ncbi:MAG: NYN domain-containing protein [Hyphomicrobiaceae bacterium]
MLRWPVKSALYIDFENIPMAPDAIAGWLAWLEDGCFEPAGRKRRFLHKRVYWNSNAERHRQTFERFGFSVSLVAKYSGLKNGADIRMAMDIVEATYASSDIDEFMLLTGDSDFVPVLERLRSKGKRSVIVATEHRPNIHTTYAQHADVLIPTRQLGQAGQYQRQRRNLGGWLKRLVPAGAKLRLGKPATSEVKATQAPPPRRQPQRSSTPDGPVGVAVAHGPFAEALVVALTRIQALMRQQPRNFVGQRRILAELARVQGFRRRGDGAFLGHVTYRALMRELARRDACIKVVEQPGGGTGVYYLPPVSGLVPDGREKQTACPIPPPVVPGRSPPPLPENLPGLELGIGIAPAPRAPERPELSEKPAVALPQRPARAEPQRDAQREAV